MRKDSEREKNDKFCKRNSCFQKLMSDKSNETAEKNREKYRMRETAMTEHRTAFDAERISDHVRVGNHRANRREKPKPKGNGFFQKSFSGNGCKNSV